MAKKKNNGKRTRVKNNKTEKNGSQEKETPIEPALDVKNLKYETTADIKISKNIINQVIGQEEAVHIIKKAAEQRRHVLLIGEPGTGKSMLGLALAELLPKEKLADTVSFPNPDDENQPLIRTVPAGQGRDLVFRSKIEASQFFKTQNFIMFIIVIFSIMFPYWLWYTKKISDIIFAAFIISSFLFLLGFMVFMNMNRRAIDPKSQSPKVIVDNFKKKQAPFMDATGAHAGALLGDVLHDPFQTFFTTTNLHLETKNGFEKKEIGAQVDTAMTKHKTKILKKEKDNYESLYLPEKELVVLGEDNCSSSSVEVLSCNRYDYSGKMIKLTTSENEEIIVTPEHKIAIWNDGKICYKPAKDITQEDKLVSLSENTAIDEQNIIKTYDARQQEQCKLYYQYLSIKKENPLWGYKRIAKSMNQKIGKTRWWHAKKHIPVPIQTANWLKEKGLLPFKADNPNAHLIAKVLGATFGDGGVFENLNGIFLSSSEKEAVEEFGKDIETIFGLKKNENSRIIEGGEYGHSWCYQNTNRNIIRFFLAAGAPHGNKTKIKLSTPGWIKLNKQFEDEFYGSFLGGELGTPTIHKRGNYLTSVEVGITGTPKFRENRIAFLNEIAEYFNRHNIQTTSIYEGRTKTQNVAMFRLLIEKKLDNILNFMTDIKLNYCKYKIDRLYCALGRWALLKKNKYYELIRRGYGAEHAMKVLNLTPESLYLLLNHFGSTGVEA